MRDSEVFVSSFEFEFVVEFSIRVSSSSSLNFRVESHFEFVVEFDFSNFVSNFKFEVVVEICRRNFRFVALFDFSNFVALFDFSNFVALFDFSNFEFSIRIFDSSALNLMIRVFRRISSSS